MEEELKATSIAGFKENAEDLDALIRETLEESKKKETAPKKEEEKAKKVEEKKPKPEIAEEKEEKKEEKKEEIKAVATPTAKQEAAMHK